MPDDASSRAESADDHRLAADLATRAGSLLTSLRHEVGHADPPLLRKQGDQAAHRFLLDELAAHRPDDAVLSEEDDGSRRRDNSAARLSTSRVWIVDPLDGTREFGEADRTDWAVHVAMCVDGVPVVGAVALPGLGTTLATLDPPPFPPPPDGPPRVVISRTRPPIHALEIATTLGATLIEMGSAGAKAMAVVRGDADVYAHSGGQFEWDSCAPVAVALAAGLHCSRLDGSPLVYANADPYLPDLLICRPELADRAIAAARW